MAGLLVGKKKYYQDKINKLKNVRKNIDEESGIILKDLCKNIIDDGIKMYEVMRENVKR